MMMPIYKKSELVLCQVCPQDYKQTTFKMLVFKTQSGLKSTTDSGNQVTDTYFQNVPSSPASSLTFLQTVSFFVWSL